jgi:hypothetical protein
MQRTVLPNSYNVKTPGSLYTGSSNFKSGNLSVKSDNFGFGNNTVGYNPNKGGYGVNKVTGGVMGNKKFDDREIDEAKQHLRLLKEKLGSNTFGGTATGTTGNSNYRKPFQPNFENNNNNFNTNNTYTGGNTNSFKTNTTVKAVIPQNNNKIVNKKNSNFNEIIDDRPIKTLTE